MRYLVSCSVTVLVALACCTLSQGAVLYDGSADTTPDAQGWWYLPNPLVGAQATKSASGGAVNLDTTAVIGESAGFFSVLPGFPAHPGVGTLDSSTGFAVTFDLQLVSEDHSLSTDRAGFSVIILDNAAKGVELGFWTDRIWAQTDTPLFTRSGTEQTLFDTTSNITRYKIIVRQGGYSLLIDGAEAFGGSLKDYSAFDHVAAGLPADPYEMPSFIFFGDDTGSAMAEVNVSRVELIPEPATGAFLAMALAGLVVKRRKRANLRG